MDAMLPALPVEIWQQILDEVLDDPTVQTSCNANDFHRFIYAGGNECEVEARRRNLAAVCQTWKAIAKSYTYRSLIIPENIPLVPRAPLYFVRRLCLNRSSTLHKRSKALSAETLDRWCNWIRASQHLAVLEINMQDDPNPTNPWRTSLHAPSL